jgi:hypothetical protein
MNGTNYKYRLNLPEFLVTNGVYQLKNYWLIGAINGNEELCVAPLLNVTGKGEICFKKEVKIKEEFVNALFCTYFNLEITSGIKNYIELPKPAWLYTTTCQKAIDNFYKNWEKEGKLQLVKMPKID